MNITFTNAVEIFTMLVIFGLVPGVGMTVIMAKSITYGFRGSLVLAAGIASGDLVFVLLAIYGMSLVASVSGEFFAITKYLGAGYFTYLGVKVFKSSFKQQEPQRKSYADFLGGLMTSLSNPKVILFYLSFFPSFIDLTKVTPLNSLTILAITFTAIFGAMISFAFLATKISLLLKTQKGKRNMDYFTAFVFFATALIVIFKA